MNNILYYVLWRALFLNTFIGNQKNSYDFNEYCHCGILVAVKQFKTKRELFLFFYGTQNVIHFSYNFPNNFWFAKKKKINSNSEQTVEEVVPLRSV